MAKEIKKTKVTLHPLNSDGSINTNVNLYPKAMITGIVDTQGNEVSVPTSDEVQEVLISGENIKTINNESILGAGNIEIESGGTEVIANPEMTGEEELLTSIQIGEEKFKVKDDDKKKNKPQVKLFPFKFKLVDKPTPEWTGITSQKFKIHISPNKTTIDSDELLNCSLMSNSSFSIALNSGKYGKKAVYLSRQNKYSGTIKPTLQNLKHLRKRYVRHYTNSDFTFKDLINVLMNDDNFVDNHINDTEDVARLFYTNTYEASLTKHKLSIRLNLKNMSKDVLKNIATNSNLRSRYTLNSALSRVDRKYIFNGTCKLMILNASYYEQGDQYIPDNVYYYLNITKVRISEENMQICFTDDIDELANDSNVYGN